MKTMVALVGGQTLPNYLPILHYRPDNVVLAFTKTTKNQYENIKSTIEKNVKVYGLEVDPFNIPEIAETMNSFIHGIEKDSTGSLTFNLTGGTKTMSLAAYQVASQHNASVIYLQSEGKQTKVYRYGWKDHQLEVVEVESIPEHLKLQDVFDLHLGANNWKEHGPSKEEGGFLEDAIANTLRDAGYEVMVGVKALKNNIDVDVAVRRDNQYCLIEAKTGAAGKKIDGIKQLSMTGKLLGTYSQPLLVITIPPEISQEMVIDAFNIEVISLPTFERGSRVLPPEEATKLLEKVGKILKG